MLALWNLDPYYYLFILPFMLLSIWAAARVKGTFARYNRQPIRSGVSGAEAAEMILGAAGIHDVAIEAVPGMLSDHYDPARKRVCLSPEILNGRTPAAVAVAAHEVGHALQHAQAYAPMQWRAAIVPAVNITSQLAMPMFLAGIFFQFSNLILIAIACFAVVVLFHLVTLPVEFDASARAIRILGSTGIVTADELPGVRKTLYAAGFTYVASALAAVAQLLYFLWRAGLLGGDNRRNG